MRVTKAQAQANREHIVETASVLFRERGFDGVGVADLMAAAGFTHGGFYKHFGSKADLMAEAAASSLAQSLTDNAGIDVADFVDLYVSRDHRDGRGGGCTMAALCGDAARQSPELKATFANGIENTLAALESRYEAGQDAPQEAIRAKCSTCWRMPSVRSCCRVPARTIPRWPMKSSRYAAPGSSRRCRRRPRSSLEGRAPDADWRYSDALTTSGQSTGWAPDTSRFSIRCRAAWRPIS